MTLHHSVDGRGGRVLVLSGSLGTTLDLWQPQVRPLSANFRVVRYDHPGHGRSPLPAQGASAEDFAVDVLRLLDQLGVKGFSFCGLSLGGQVAMALALRAGDRLERLALCCTATRIATPAYWSDRAAVVRRGGLDAIADGLVGRWFTEPYAVVKPEIVQRYREMLVSTPPEGYARCCEILASFDVGGRLGDLEVPTLVLAGEEDSVVSVGDAHELQRSIRHSRLAVLPRAAHLPNVEQSDGFNQELLAFLSAEA